jgi:hypothetical protein
MLGSFLSCSERRLKGGCRQDCRPHKIVASCDELCGV